MELRKFVSTSLLDIVNGVADAQAESQPNTIVPQTNTSTNFVNTGLTQFQVIEMNVIVRIEDTAETSGKISVWSSGVGGSSATQAGQETTLAFKVPVRFPTQTK